MSKRERSSWHLAWDGISLGWDLALPIFVGVLVGHWLDRRLGTGYWLTLGFLFLGVVAGFYNMFRSYNRMEARHRRRQTGRVRPEEEAEER